MNSDLVKQMLAINAQVEQHIDYMLEHSMDLPDSGPAMYWLAVLDHTITVLRKMDCPAEQVQRAVDLAHNRFDQKIP